MKATAQLVLAIAVLSMLAAQVVSQSCVTSSEVKAMVARLKSPAQNVAFNKKLNNDLINWYVKDQERFREFLLKQDKDKNAGKELENSRSKMQVSFCRILKEHGWPISKLVGEQGVTAAFALFQNLPSYHLQRDMLPVIVAAVDKHEIGRPHLAALFDRMRVRTGMKQLFGTQVTITDGFLVLAPIENEAQVEARRREFDLPPLDRYLKLLERDYRRPLIRSTGATPRSTPSRSRSLEASALGDLVTPEAPAEFEVLRIETNLVSLNVSVYSNKLRTTVSNLEQKDFSVFEDGREETVTYFAATDMPFDLVLLIDLSGSTRDKRELIRKSTRRFIEAARPSDRLSIVVFSDQAEVISPLTTDRGQLLASVNRIDATEGASNVWDSVAFALDQAVGLKSVERRRAVLLMSDGVDNALGYSLDDGSSISFADLLEKVRHSDAMLIPIYLDTESDRSSFGFLKTMYQNARNTLALLAEESGGLYYKARKIDDLEGVYEQVINDLGKVYSLGYKPSNEKHDGTWRAVKVQLTGHPELSPRTRLGYYAN
jgi:VWFA-related protein